MSLIISNPWGKALSFDAQRNDLWLIDLSQVLLLIRNPTGITLGSRYQALLANLPPASQLEFYAQKIVLPEQSISTLPVMVGSQSHLMPHYDEAPSVVRIDFIHSAADYSVNAIDSKIYCLMAAWQMLANAGKSSFGQNPELPLTSPKANLRVTADIGIQLLKGGEANVGTTVDQAKSILAGTGDTGQLDTSPEAYLQTSASYTLKKAWCSDLQLGELDQSNGNVLLQILASLQCSAVVQS